MIGGISPIGAPGVISNITAATLQGKVGAVDRVKKNQEFEPYIVEVTAENTPETMKAFPKTGDENPTAGEAYGLPANQLRNRGMALQLERDENNSDASTESSKQPENPDGFPVAGDSAVAQDKNSAAEEVDNQPAARDNAKKSNGERLTNEEQSQLDELQSRDREVHAHEQAHLSAAGGYATSGAKYEHQHGPDGKNYAIGGSVGIDTSEAGSPQATITKMQTVRRAALAPAQPSGQDRAVAAEAAQKLAAAQRELRQQSGETENGETAEPIENDAAEAAGSAIASETLGSIESRENSQNTPLVAEFADDNENSVKVKTEKVVTKVARNNGMDSPIAKLSYQNLRGQMFYRTAV